VTDIWVNQVFRFGYPRWKPYFSFRTHTNKIQSYNMARQNKGAGSSPWELQHAYDKQQVGSNAKAKRCVYDGQKSDKLQKDWVFRVGSWNVDSLTGRAGEVVKVLELDDRKVDITCVQETKWMGLSCRVLVLWAEDIICFRVDVTRKPRCKSFCS